MKQRWRSLDLKRVTLKKTLKEIWTHCWFRKNAQLKIIAQKTLPKTIIGSDINIKKFEKDYNKYHITYKYKFLKPILLVGIYIFAKLNKKVLGKSFIEYKYIERNKGNRVITAWKDAIRQTCNEAPLVLRKNLKEYENPDSAYWVKFVKLINDVIIQNVMYDTFYRSLFEMIAVNFANNMNKAFKDDKKHVLYNKKHLDDIDFWMAVERNTQSHLVMQDKLGIIVVPVNQALRMQKQDVEKLYHALKMEEEKNKKK